METALSKSEEKEGMSSRSCNTIGTQETQDDTFMHRSHKSTKSGQSIGAPRTYKTEQNTTFS